MASGIRWVIIATAALFVGTAWGPPLVSGAFAAGAGRLDTALVARLFGGEVESVDYIVHGPSPVRGSLSWADFALWIESTALAGGLQAQGPVDAGGCQVGLPGLQARVACGPDTGYGDGQRPSEYCDDSSGWVAYTGAPPGSAYQVLDDPRPTSVVRCSCTFWVPCFDWGAVELSPSKDDRVLAGLAWEGCYSESWVVHPNGFCPNSFDSEALPLHGALDTFALHWRARGVGIAASISVGTGAIDYFIGYGATTCYDMPTFPAEGADPVLQCLVGSG